MRTITMNTWHNFLAPHSIYHVSHVEEGDLAKEMLEEQVGNDKMLQIETQKRLKTGRKHTTKWLKRHAYGETRHL